MHDPAHDRIVLYCTAADYTAKKIIKINKIKNKIKLMNKLKKKKKINK